MGEKWWNLINHGLNLNPPTATSHIKKNIIYLINVPFSPFKNSHMHTWCRLRNITANFFYLLWSHLWSYICPCINTDGRHVKWQLPGEVWTTSFLIIGERTSINIEFVLFYITWLQLHLYLNNNNNNNVMLCYVMYL